MTRFFGKNKSWTEGLSILPFAIFAALSFTIPYVITGIFLGPEFPSIIGGLIGLGIVTTLIKLNMLIPKDTWDFPNTSSWPKSWLGSFEISEDFLREEKINSFKAWLPYLLLAIILVLTRTFEPLTILLKSINLKFSDILGEKGISGSFQLLYLPGGILILVSIITFFIHQMKIPQISNATKDSFKTILGAGFVLIFTVPLVRIMINSGINDNELSSMPIAMASGVSNFMGEIYPFFAPSIGAIGAFLAGSNTVSNLMLSQFQFETANFLGISGILMVAAQSVGAAAGNMIAIHNVVAASATVGLLGREGATLRITIIPTFYYLIFSGVITLIFLNFFQNKDPLLKEKIYDVRTFAGPMGMGLAKSYKVKNLKVCIYNTIKGQEKINLSDKNLDCPKDLKN
jgi:lactate permease